MTILDIKPGVNAAQGEDFTRLEFPKRVAIEKGMYPDEAIMLCQISGGDGILVKGNSTGEIYDPNTGTVKIDREAIGNVFFNRFHHFEIISPTPNEVEAQKFQIWPYTYTKKKFGDLMKDSSILVVNGAVYYANKDFDIVESPNDIGSYDGFIKWTKTEFKLDANDVIVFWI